VCFEYKFLQAAEGAREEKRKEDDGRGKEERKALGKEKGKVNRFNIFICSFRSPAENYPAFFLLP